MPAMSRDAELHARLRLLYALYGDPDRAHKVLQRQGSALAALEANIPAGTRQRLLQPQSTTVADTQLRLAQQVGGRWLIPTDPDWPTGLPDSPAVCLRGVLSSGAAVAIVGSRDADDYGLEVAGRLAHTLAHAGVSVVSGAAFGVDWAAHEAALEAGGHTLAVLGTGVCGETSAPRNALLDRIVDGGGGVMSEYLIEAAGHKKHYPNRNRIVARLAGATVVVQGKRKTGCRHTVKHAEVVFAIPGDVTHAESHYPHELLSSGAAQWLKQPGDLAAVLKTPALAGATWQRLSAQPLTPTGRVLSALAKEALSLDGLGRRTGLDADALNGALFDLELDGQIKRTSAGSFERAQKIG